MLHMQVGRGRPMNAPDKIASRPPQRLVSQSHYIPFIPKQADCTNHAAQALSDNYIWSLRKDTFMRSGGSHLCRLLISHPNTGNLPGCPDSSHLHP